MARRPSTAPTDGELEILNVLWNHPASELATICAQLRLRRAVATTTVATMLRVMLTKGLVVREPGPRGAQWSAAVEKERTQTRLVDSLVSQIFDGSAGLLVDHLLGQTRLSASERDTVRALMARLDKAKQRNPGGES
jgi:predicted transcriptional regulator